MLRALIRDLTARIRADGGEVGPGVRRLLYALHTAAQRAERPALDNPPAFDSVTAPFDSSATGSTTTAPGTVGVSVAEAAALMGCSPEWVRALIRRGVLSARRIGARTWEVDRDALDDYRHGRRSA
ncbi:helix-turn-helix domain-containing protein [Streptomyces radiopugnans]|nr:helix-turn-helix domain-containing protein [Streptomyces radiopugnans]